MMINDATKYAIDKAIELEKFNVLDYLLDLDINTTHAFVSPVETSSEISKYRHYTSAEEELITKLYQEGKSEDEVASRLNRTTRAIHDKICSLRKKNPESFPYRSANDTAAYARYCKLNSGNALSYTQWLAKKDLPKATIQGELDATRMEKRLESE